MRRLIAPLAVALALAAAPSALASHTTEVHTTSASLGPGHSVIVSGTIQCTAGYTWGVSLFVRQKSGRVWNVGNTGVGGGRVCLTDGPEPWTTDPFFGTGPFKRGAAVVEAIGQVCDPEFSHCATDQDILEVRLST